MASQRLAVVNCKHATHVSVFISVAEQQQEAERLAADNIATLNTRGVSLRGRVKLEFRHNFKKKLGK